MPCDTNPILKGSGYERMCNKPVHSNFAAWGRSLHTLSSCARTAVAELHPSVSAHRVLLHGFPLFRAPPVCVRLLMMLQGKGGISCRAGQEVSGRYCWRHWDVPPRHPSLGAGKQCRASACCAVLGDDADLLVRQRKCQPSPKSSEEARKGLTLPLQSHLPHGVLPALPALLI